MLRFLVLSAALLAVPVAAHAQQTDRQLWLQTNGSTQIAKDTRVTLESIGRFGDAAGGFSHAELGALFTRAIAKGVEIGIGYRHVEDWDHGDVLPNEERLRQQVVFTLGGGVMTRLRLEQRFNSRGGPVGVRIRPQLRYALPLAAKGPSLFVSHEDFFNFNDTGWGQRSGYERTRNAIGLSVPLSQHVTTDIGYLNQYRFGRDGGRDKMDHALTMALAITL
ncbi:DUF2490 domain-containing protein [Sphingomonas sp. MMS12-HWE2-04]|uniref:DUF2490 domain-containing protein n=1 Tax=Sphingomonas sp. MMS12-HWE2-04 TaxID=3234199 RepID=UPI00384D8919